MAAKRRLRLLTVVGARPQFIKAAALSRAIAAYNQASPSAAIDEEILHTGQHYDPMMSQVFFDEMDIPPPVVNLHTGAHSGHGEATAAMLVGIERELLARKPDCVLVYGDTNSTLAGALAAVKIRIPVAHMEAGMRCGDRWMPEEINRVLVDRVASVLFCSSERARENLAREGVADGVYVVGDMMYDSVVHFRLKAIPPRVSGPFGLCTLHRAENTDDPQRLRNILLRPGGIARARPLAASSADAEDDAAGGDCRRRTDHAPGARLLSRHAWLHPAVQLRRHRLRRDPEGGVFPRQAVHHRARADRVG